MYMHWTHIHTYQMTKLCTERQLYGLNHDILQVSNMSNIKQRNSIKKILRIFNQRIIDTRI